MEGVNNIWRASPDQDLAYLRFSWGDVSFGKCQNHHLAEWANTSWHCPTQRDTATFQENNTYFCFQHSNEGFKWDIMSSLFFFKCLSNNGCFSLNTTFVVRDNETHLTYFLLMPSALNCTWWPFPETELSSVGVGNITCSFCVGRDL